MKVSAFAPATVANVAVGFDLLGFPLSNVGDVVTLEKIPSPKTVRITSIEGVSGLPLESQSNTATFGVRKILQDLKLDFGFEVSIKKGIPLSSGMGGSAASAVASVVAANEFLAPAQKMSPETMLSYAAAGEALASGGIHYDNITPCLYGGLTCSLGLVDPKRAPLKIETPKSWHCMVAHPPIQISTKESRAQLPKEVALSLHVKQSSLFAGAIFAFQKGDPTLLKDCFHDLIVEPHRKKQIPGFEAAKDAALAAGALGFSISGSGPSVFAICESKEVAVATAKAVTAAFKITGISEVKTWVSPISPEGARVIKS